MKMFHAWFTICGLFAVSPDLLAQFTYSTNGSVITLVSYTGAGPGVTISNFVSIIAPEAFTDPGTLTSVSIPSSVVSIEDSAFGGCTELSSVTIYGSSITNIGPFAFSDCWNLTSLYFTGNAPPVSGQLNFEFPVPANVTAYYLVGNGGWDTFATLTLVRTVPWNPPILTNNGGIAIQSNQFGFTITGSTNLPIIVEASTNLASGAWTLVQSCTITNGSIYFTDPAWTNYPSRFYKVALP
ncbi:MAG TPA: leucine-rich repeat protein [Verrucomicrobiae bacterium]|nr:leucine-rich repeat protein [Verrucomicrobiae bacterium]